MDKHEVISNQIARLGEQIEKLINEFTLIDFGKMYGITTKMEFDNKIRNIDARIDALLDKLED